MLTSVVDGPLKLFVRKSESSVSSKAVIGEGGSPSCVGKSNWILRWEGVAWKVTQFPSSGRWIMRCHPVYVSSSSRLHILKSPARSRRSSSIIVCILVCGFARERVIPSSGALNWRASGYYIHTSSSVGDTFFSMPSSCRSWPDSGGFSSWSFSLGFCSLRSPAALSRLASLLCCLSSLSCFWMFDILPYSTILFKYSTVEF